VLAAILITEAPIEPEAVTADTFIADLDRLVEHDRGRLEDLARRVAAAPRRRIYD
jgi:hypothetical protein